jgi:hypothetical protein
MAAYVNLAGLGGGLDDPGGPSGSIVALDREGEALGAQHRRDATDACQLVLALAFCHDVTIKSPEG